MLSPRPGNRSATRCAPSRRQSSGPTRRAGTASITFPKEAHAGLAALGAYGICVPEEFGGAGLDYLTLALVLEEIAAGDGGTSTAISVTNCPVNAILMRYGNARRRRSGCTPLAQGELLGAFCLTEPHVGSDASALRTTRREATATAT